MHTLIGDTDVSRLAAIELYQEGAAYTQIEGLI